MVNNKKLLTIHAASSLLGINPGTLRRWAQENKVKAYKVGTRGDWRFKEKDLQSVIIKNDVTSHNADSKYLLINKFLITHADSIQKLATQLHKKFLGGKRFRTEFISKYQKNHIKIVKEIASNLQRIDLKRGTTFFNKFGEAFGREAIKDGLTIEETVDGIIFLKQAVWQQLKEKGLLKKFTTIEIFDISQVIGTYCDVVASKIAFTYHEYYKEKAEKEKDRLYNLFMQAPIPVAITKGPSHIYELSNPLNDLGLGKKVTIGKSVKEHFPGTEQNGVIALLNQVYKTGKPYNGKELPFHVNIPGVGKQTRYINFTYQPLKDINNKIEGIMVVANDVTEQVTARQALEESEERFRALTNASSDVVYRMSPDWREMRQLQGRSFLANTGKPDRNWLKKYIHPNDQEHVLKVIKEAIRTKSVFELEHQVKRADGKLGWTFSRAIPILDKNGEIVEWFGAAIDVTEQKQAGEALMESEERFRTLADNIPNLVWMANPDGYIFWYNSRWYEYTGTTPKDMEGWGWQSVHDPKKLPQVLEQWKKSLKNGTVFEMIFPLKGADSIFRPFLTRVVPIRDNVGKVVRWFGTNTDITKQKELERQKDNFLGIASHELKTPVTSIKAYGQVLERIFHKKGDTKSAGMLEKMGTQVDKLTSLIEDLLDVTKIHSGRLEFHENRFDFDELVTEVVEELQRTTEKHRIVKKLSESKKVFGDRDRTGQVITNLISNAIKYSPNANKIIIRTEFDQKNITLHVQDFGIGIPQEKQGRVFEQFFRVSGDREITFPGLGLGLYVSSEIVKRTGGKIWVRSIKGRGSTFSFSLPISKKSTKC